MLAANNLLTRMAEMPKATVRIIEIAELLDVCKQRAHQLAAEDGFPEPVAEDARGGCGIGER